jgi:HNH endonuclease
MKYGKAEISQGASIIRTPPTAAVAEAHHIVPLSQLRESVKTRLEDLATVCANCHRLPAQDVQASEQILGN